MNKILFLTKNLVLSRLSNKNYEDITKLYEDIEDTKYATGVFSAEDLAFAEKKLERRIKTRNIDETTYLLAAKSTKNNEFIGFLKGRLYKKRGIFWLHTLIIKKEERSKGFGGEIVRGFSAYLHDCKDTKLIALSVHPENKAAALFWKSQNFNIIQTLINSGNDECHMSKVKIYVKKI